jgi:hypothetical protein
MLFPKFSLIALLTTSLSFFPLAVQAGAATARSSNYQSNSGATRFLLINEGEGAAQWRMDYQTTVQGQRWSGEVQAQRVLGRDGNRSIYGTFKDMPGTYINPREPQVFCTGDFVGTQSFRNDRYFLDVQWSVTGGKGCPTIGQKVNLQLSEAIPVANAAGDFYFENSRVWFGLGTGQNEFHTWDRWQVVESGSLNCRERPNGAIVRKYRQGDHFEAKYDGRGIASAILGADNTETNPSSMDPNTIKGKPWMLTTDKCFVRSNRRHIQPLSASQPFQP